MVCIVCHHVVRWTCFQIKWNHLVMKLSLFSIRMCRDYERYWRWQRIPHHERPFAIISFSTTHTNQQKPAPHLAHESRRNTNMTRINNNGVKLIVSEMASWTYQVLRLYAHKSNYVNMCTHHNTFPPLNTYNTKHAKGRWNRWPPKYYLSIK